LYGEAKALETKMRNNQLIKIGVSLAIFALTILLLTSVSHAQLQEIKTAIRLKSHQWVAGETSISRLSPQEKKMRVALIKPTHTEGAPVLSVQETEPPTGLPSGLDWTNNGGNFVTPVRNQGNCGSCWAFATTAALESVLLRSGVPTAGLDKSEQVLVSCGSAGSCDGGYITTASNFIRNTGLPAEACYPYTGTDGTCSSACANWQTSTSKIAGWSYVTTTSTTADALKNGLNSFGPLVTTMDVYEDFFYYTSGVYAHSSGTYAGGHAVLLVGYDDPGQYFIVKNSWGTGWGESGYFRIAYAEVNSVVNFGDWTIAYTPAVISGDSTPPTVTGFSIPSTATSLTVNITTFTATDNAGVTGYRLTESATAPSASASGWSATAPETYTFSSAGTKTLYAWAKDAAGNVSTSLSRVVGITLPVLPNLNILWRQTAGGGAIGVWYMNGVTPTGSAFFSAVSDQTWQIAGVADFNGDGKPDILWRQTAGGGAIGVWYMNGVTPTGSAFFSAVSDQTWQIAGAY
jgi:C1A family cysteine protease